MSLKEFVERYLEKPDLIEVSEPTVMPLFQRKLEEGGLIRSENLESHFAVFFIGYDPDTRKVFIGRHKKAQLWLPNGGHIEEGELPIDTLKLEVSEEWGYEVSGIEEIEPGLLTITIIDNERQTCKTHYDIWYFIALNEGKFKYDEEKVHKEFEEIGWKTIEQARQLVTHPQTLKALRYLEEKLS